MHRTRHLHAGSLARSAAVVLGAFVLLPACRPDPGPAPYDEDYTPRLNPDFLPGPDPWEPGTPRLSIGAFYEGGSSDIVEIDDMTTHYYIYDSTFTQTEDFEDRVEGNKSDVIRVAGIGWFGGGVHWDSARDLSDWTVMRVSLKTDAAALDALDFIMNDGAEARLSASAYGYATDGEWHHLAVPLADFVGAGIDPATIEAPFVFVAAGGSAGDELRIDNLYFTQE